MTENDSRMTLFYGFGGDILLVVDQSNKKQPVKQLAIARLGKKKEGNKNARILLCYEKIDC